MFGGNCHSNVDSKRSTSIKQTLIFAVRQRSESISVTHDRISVVGGGGVCIVSLDIHRLVGYVV